MHKRYIVTGSWYDKVKLKYVSGISEINKGINKEQKDYEMLNTDNREDPIDGAYPVGTIFSATFNLEQENPSKAPLNLKSGNQ